MTPRQTAAPHFSRVDLSAPRYRGYAYPRIGRPWDKLAVGRRFFSCLGSVWQWETRMPPRTDRRRRMGRRLTGRGGHAAPSRPVIFSRWGASMAGVRRSNVPGGTIRLGAAGGPVPGPPLPLVLEIWRDGWVVLRAPPDARVRVHVAHCVWSPYPSVQRLGEELAWLETPTWARRAIKVVATGLATLCPTVEEYAWRQIETGVVLPALVECVRSAGSPSTQAQAAKRHEPGQRVDARLGG